MHSDDDHIYTEEAGHAVDKVEHFDFESIDTLEDLIREALASGQPVKPILDRLIQMESNERVNEAIAGVIGYIADAEKPRLAADHIAWISGMRFRQGMSLPSIAKKHGVSKQAFCTAALKLATILNLKPARAMRSELAREAMRKAHFKRIRK